MVLIVIIVGVDAEVNVVVDVIEIVFVELGKQEVVVGVAVEDELVVVVGVIVFAALELVVVIGVVAVLEVVLGIIVVLEVVVVVGEISVGKSNMIKN